MKLQMFKSKIHRAVVTEANVDYEGSVTIDAQLMELADILPYEAVHIWNVTRGTRCVTYCIEGPRDSGAICVNGAAAHLHHPGDVVILATFADMERDEARAHRPRVVLVGPRNRVESADHVERPAPSLGLPSAEVPAPATGLAGVAAAGMAR